MSHQENASKWELLPSHIRSSAVVTLARIHRLYRAGGGLAMQPALLLARVSQGALCVADGKQAKQTRNRADGVFGQCDMRARTVFVGCSP